MTDRKRLFSIFLIVFIDLLGFSIILPLLPFYAETFGASPTVVGLLVAIYAAAQMISAPLLGRLSDRFGRRPLLLISILGGSIGFFLLGIAQTLTMLFIARLLAGITGGNISIAQAYITDVTDSKNRSRGLGLIGAAFGLGFIIGPALGGILSQWGYALPAYTAAGVALVNFFAALLWLPESLTAERKQEIVNQKRPAISIKALGSALRRPVVGNLLHTRLIYGFAFALFQSIFALYGQYRFNLNSQNIGYILAFVGVLSAITQGFVIGKLSDRFADRQLIFFSVSTISASMLAWALAPNVIFLIIVLAPIAVSAGILNTIINAALTKAVPPSEFGGILGLSASLESATRVIAPTIGGLLLDKLGTSAPGILSAGVLIWLSSYVFRNIYRSKTIEPIIQTNTIA
ncbi:MAG: MFS transporter [Chloroflexi bacterium HGW-Chloroflexi-10]|nr:MAG: MFS transporter [Chloroflexi bacterium HGW-Chloroflexi-10]